jgi:hypothetical protein
VVKKLRIKCE